MEVLGDEGLSKLARELTVQVRKSATLDWDRKESVQAWMRVMIKGLLREYGYPPDGRTQAVLLVIEQAKVLGINFVEGASEASGG